MLKSLLHFPSIFDPDENKRRQVLNILLILLIATSLVAETLILLTTCKCIPILPKFSGAQGAQVLGIFGLILPGVLLLVNRSARVPFWSSGAVFGVFVIALLSQTDSPYELYSGRSAVIWVIPIMLGAMVFHPTYGFLIATITCIMMQVFTGSGDDLARPVNYYSMLILFLVAFISWMGMNIANRAIRDARRQAAHLETILNNIADGVLVLDQQGNTVSANPALLKMIPEDELEELASQPIQKIMRWKHKVFAATATPLPEAGSVVIFRDQTRCHETEQARNSLLATVSHEFRTPLAAVMNYLEMLLMLIEMQKVDTEAFSQHLTRALENSRRLHRMVINILDQAQIQSGILELKEQRFNLPELIEKSSQLLDVQRKQKRLSYELSITQDTPTEINGDPERLRQVLVNLIGNAIKFTSQGGVKVRVFKSADERLSIEVADTGPGIPDEQLPDIFEAFRRSSNYAHRQQQGAGLGLSITKEIITRMGGEISVSSVLDVGSTFTVSLPLNRAKQAWILPVSTKLV